MAIEYKNKINYEILRKIKSELEESKLPYKVDVLDINNISDEFRDIIKKKMIVFPLKFSDKIPKLRFKEFSGNWEEKELNKVAKINPKSIELPNEFIYIDLESVEKGLLVKSNKILKIEAPSRAQRLLSNEDILFQTVRPYQKNNYFFELGDNYVASTGYAQIRANESSTFLYQKLHTSKFVNKVLLRCTGTSYPAINSTDLSKIKIDIPKKQEQEKIALFLTSVDTKIEQLTKKETLLKEYKKGVMQKIFNQEIRFKADGGNNFPKWNDEQFGNLFNFLRGSSLSKSDLTHNGINKCIHYGELFTRYNEKITNVVSSTNLTDGQMSLVGDILMPSSDVTPQGLATASVLLENDVIVGGDTNILRPKIEINSLFISYFLNMNKKEIMKLVTGTTVKHIYNKDISKLKITLPCIEEQTKISNFLSSIDTKIEKIQKQLEQTKEFKKALLQQMFV